MRVSTLAEPQVRAYRDLMLEAYEREADAFTTTAQERRAEPLSWWVQRVGAASGPAQSFGAWSGDELVGTVALEFSAKPKTRHTALVLGMYVKPQHRGQGAGRQLMRAAIDAASGRAGVEVLTLTLTEGNLAAQRLYESVGFVAWGVAPLAIRTPSGFKGKVHLSMVLTRAGAAA